MEMVLPKTISNINITQIGDEKVISLLKFLSIMLDTQTNSKISKAKLRSLLDDSMANNTDYEYPIAMIFIFLADHDEYFGRIDIEKFDLS